MKKFAITTAAALLGLAPWAAADEAKTENKPDCTSCCTKDGSCQPPCTKSDKGVSCGEEAWLDIETVTVEAANGDPIAQYTVAYLIETGDENSKPDADKAQEWYAKSVPGLEKAAAEGHIGACRALARMYAEGKGVDKNPEMAEKYSKMAKELWEKKCAEKKAADAAANQPAQN